MAIKRDQRQVALNNIDKIEPYGETAKGMTASMTANLAANVSSATASVMTNMAEADAVSAAQNVVLQRDEAGVTIMPEFEGFKGGLNTAAAWDAAIGERYKADVALGLQEKLSDAHDSNLYNEEKYRQEAAIIIGATGDAISNEYAGWFTDLSTKVNSEISSKIGYRSAVRNESEARKARNTNAPGRGMPSAADIVAETANVIEGFKSSENPNAYFDPEGNLYPDAAITAQTIATNNLVRGISTESNVTPQGTAAQAADAGLNEEVQAKVGSVRSAELASLHTSNFKPYWTSRGKISADGKVAAQAASRVRGDDTGFSWTNVTQGQMDDMLSINDAAGMVDPRYYLDGHAASPSTPYEKLIMENQYATGHYTKGLEQTFNMMGSAAIEDPMQANMIGAIHTRAMESLTVRGGWMANNEDANARIMATKAFLRLHNPQAEGFADEWKKHREGIRKADLEKDELKEAGVENKAVFKVEAEKVLKNVGLDPTLGTQSYTSLLQNMVRRGMTLDDAKAELKNDLTDNQMQDTWGRSRSDDFIGADGKDVGFVWRNDDWGREGQFAAAIHGRGPEYMDRAARMAVEAVTGKEPTDIRFQVNNTADGRKTYTVWSERGGYGVGYENTSIELDFSGSMNDLAQLHSTIGQKDNGDIVRIERKISELEGTMAEQSFSVPRLLTDLNQDNAQIERDLEALYLQRDAFYELDLSGLDGDVDRILRNTVVKGALQ